MELFRPDPDETTAGCGYSSEKNLIFLKENEIKSYIKLQMHEKMKTKAYKEDIGKHYNMMYIIEEDIHYYRFLHSEFKKFEGTTSQAVA